MFEKPISTAFAPNVEKDDLLLSLKLLFGKREHRDENPVEKLENEFKDYHGVKYAASFSSGRAALYYALKSLGLSEGDEVLTQTLTCVAVPNSIIWADLRPVYVDIDPKTYNLSPKDLIKKITKRARVVIIQHTFGIPGPLDDVLEIAKKHNLIVIEDCAHALGVTYKNKKVGAFGDIAIFSFGRDKMISSVFGGLTITQNIRIYQNLLKFSQNLVDPPPSFVNQQLFYPLLYTISLPFYSIFVGKILIKMASILGFLSKAVQNKEKRGEKPDFLDYKLSPSLALLVLNQFRKLEAFLEHRKGTVALYDKSLNRKPSDASRQPSQLLPLLRYPLLVKDKQAILKSAKSSGMYLGDWYNSPIATGENYENMALRRFFYDFGTCKKAEAVSKSIINLPTHINLSLEQAKKVCNFLNDNRDLIF